MLFVVCDRMLTGGSSVMLSWVFHSMCVMLGGWQGSWVGPLLGTQPSLFSVAAPRWSLVVSYN